MFEMFVFYRVFEMVDFGIESIWVEVIGFCNVFGVYVGGFDNVD